MNVHKTIGCAVCGGSDQRRKDKTEPALFLQETQQHNANNVLYLFY